MDSKAVQRNRHWVVLVDDEEAIRLSVGDFLYDEGYEVTACDGAESLFEVLGHTNNNIRNKSNINNKSRPQPPPQTQLLQKMLPDVIVSDVRMPGINGIELLGILRTDSRYQRIPVVLLTAKGMTADRIAGYKAGADAYLPKPFHPDELLSILDNAILRRQQVQRSNNKNNKNNAKNNNNNDPVLDNLKQEMETIKNVMKQNTETTFKQTNVYLTPTERDVLELVCQGLTSKEIAQERGVSNDRIVKIIQKLFLETQTKKRTELVRWAFDTGYASPRQ